MDTNGADRRRRKKERKMARARNRRQTLDHTSEGEKKFSYTGRTTEPTTRPPWDMEYERREEKRGFERKHPSVWREKANRATLNSEAPQERDRGVVKKCRGIYKDKVSSR